MSKYFDKEEFDCVCCGENITSDRLIRKLDRARDLAMVPFKINSGYRCQVHNKAVGGKKTSSHTLGLAADISATTSSQRGAILSSLYVCGFTRIGIAKNFIHVDIDTGKDGDVTWVY